MHPRFVICWNGGRPPRADAAFAPAHSLVSHDPAFQAITGFKMLSSATSSNGATGASRLLSVLLLAALLCLLLGAGSEVNAQQLTTFTDTE